GDTRACGTPGQRAAHADAPAAGLGDLAHREPRVCQHVERPGRRLRDGPDLVAAAQPGRIEDVGAGRLVTLPGRDRVVEVGVAADVVLGPRGEREGEAQAARALHGGRDALDGLAEVV